MIQRANGGPALAGPRNRLSQQELDLVTPPRSPRREVQVGLFVLAGLLCILVALFILTDPGTFRGRYYVTTVLEDAGGIRKRDPVQLRGVNIGRVHDLQIAGDHVVMSLELQREYEVPDDSRVQLAAKGLLGEMVVDVLAGSSPERLENRGVLPAVESVGGLSGKASELVDTAEELAPRADTVLLRAQQLLSERNVGAMSESTQQMRALLTQLTALAAEQRRELAALTGSLRRSAEGIEGAATRPELARAMARTDSLTFKLDQATASLQSASASLAVVAGRIERGEGTLGRLAADDSLYVNLNRAVANISQLTDEIRRDPKKYLSVSVF
ncbi:MAG TPA: MlaD family protein [Longimicrobiaceae bacterium]|nr:MlaD family protein [Longimicrobiaceae bacterium]